MRRIKNCEFLPVGDGFKCRYCRREVAKKSQRNCPERSDIAEKRRLLDMERREQMEALEAATDCVFRGAQVREIGCELCGGRTERIPIYTCTNPLCSPECTPTIRGKARDENASVNVCLDCDKQQHPDDNPPD